MRQIHRVSFVSALIAIALMGLLAACTTTTATTITSNTSSTPTATTILGSTPSTPTTTPSTPPTTTTKTGTTPSNTPAPSNSTKSPSNSTKSSTPFQVTSIGVSAGPNLSGYRCGTTFTESYTATFTLAPGGPGGTILFQYTTNNGRSSSATNSPGSRRRPDNRYLRLQMVRDADRESHGSWNWHGHALGTESDDLSSSDPTWWSRCL